MGAETLGIILGSVAAAGIGAAGAAATNASSQSFVAGESEEARNWQERMYHQSVRDARSVQMDQNAEYRKRLQYSAQQQKELQQYLFENYNSPAAQAAALRKGGLNPSVLLGGQSSPFGSQDLPNISTESPTTPTMPSVPGASTVNSPALSNPGAFAANSVQQITSSLASLSMSKKQDAETQKAMSLLQGELKEQILKNKGLEIANNYQEFYTSFMQTNLPEKFKKEIGLLSDQAMYYYSMGESAQSEKVCKDIMAKLYQQKVDLQDPLVKQAFTYCGLLLKSMESDVRLKDSQSFEASAFGSKALSEKLYQDYENDLKKIEHDFKIGAFKNEDVAKSYAESIINRIKADAASAGNDRIVNEIEEYERQRIDPRNKPLTQNILNDVINRARTWLRGLRH